MNISVTFEKPGYRIKRRKIQRKKIPVKHMVTPEETMEYMKENFQVKIK
jgi:large subunit ribosomal protein L5